MTKIKEVRVWAAPSPKATLQPQTVPLEQPGPNELVLEVVASGICHSDIHLIDNDWGVSEYPLVPGHEILGRIVDKGASVPETMKIGATVGVGWQRASCGHCEACISGRDNMCDDSEATCVGHKGGFADYYVGDWRYCFVLPEKLAVPEAAPLLCGGITVYSPLREFLTNTQTRVGVVSIGGLGHLAVKFARAMGCEVTVFSSSESKRREAEQMGAHRFVSSVDANAIKSLGATLDLIIVTANVDLPWDAYLQTLRMDGTLCFVGVPPSELKLGVGYLLGKRRRIAASPIGSRARIQEMLEFCALHGILATIEKFPMEKVNDAITRVRENKVRYRGVLTTT